MLDLLYTKKQEAVKEPWSVFKIDFFHKHFRCFCLLRKTENCFPGIGRPEIQMRTYNAYFAVLFAFRKQLERYQPAIDILLESKNDNERICGTHIVVSHILETECRERGIPIIRYENLATNPREELAFLSEPRLSQVVQMVEETRKIRDDSLFRTLGVSDFCESVRAIL